jgi:hypothetical protein
VPRLGQWSDAGGEKRRRKSRVWWVGGFNVYYYTGVFSGVESVRHNRRSSARANITRSILIERRDNVKMDILYRSELIKRVSFTWVQNEKFLAFIYSISKLT